MSAIQLVLSRAWDKEKILAAHGESNLPLSLYGDQGLLRSSYMIRILHTARISNVVSVMFLLIERW